MSKRVKMIYDTFKLLLCTTCRKTELVSKSAVQKRFMITPRFLASRNVRHTPGPVYFLADEVKQVIAD